MPRPVAIYRRLALAGSLNNQSNRLAKLGLRETALEAVDEAVAIYQGLAEARPARFMRPG